MVNYFIKEGAERDGKTFFQLVRQEPNKPNKTLARKYAKSETARKARTTMMKKTKGTGKGNRRGKKQPPQYESI